VVRGPPFTGAGFSSPSALPPDLCQQPTPWDSLPGQAGMQSAYAATLRPGDWLLGHLRPFSDLHGSSWIASTRPGPLRFRRLANRQLSFELRELQWLQAEVLTGPLPQCQGPRFAATRFFSTGRVCALPASPALQGDIQQALTPQILAGYVVCEHAPNCLSASWMRLAVHVTLRG